MRHKKNDSIWESSDIDSDNDLQPQDLNGTNVDKPNFSNLRRIQSASESESECDSDNKEIAPSIPDENSSNQTSSREPGGTINADISEGESYSVNSVFNFQDLSPDDEIYMLQYPTTYKTQDLLNKVINFNKTEQILNIKNEVNQLELKHFEKKFITLALPNKSNKGTLVKLPFKGQLIINKVVETSNISYEVKEDSSKSKVVCPQDIKIRHPLLGVDWKSHIKDANKAIKKYKHMKKNKKVTKERTLEVRSDNPKLIKESREVEYPVPKKKKAKHK